MLGGKRRSREAEKWRRRAGTNENALLGPGSAATTPRGWRVAQHPGTRTQRFRSGPQTTPLAIKASISPLEYPNSVSTSVACSLNLGGTLRRRALVRSRRIGEATPLYQSFSITSPRWTVWALVSAVSIAC